jgi:hypothetical protein
MGRFAKVGLALGWVAALWFLVDWREAGATLAGADPVPVAAAFVVSVIGVLISAEKWRDLLRRARVEITFRAAARLYWIGMFFSNFLPTSVGGDAVRLALTPSRGRLARVAGSILVERLTGLIVMLGLCAVGLTLRPVQVDQAGLGQALPLAVLAMGAGAAVLLLAPGLLARILPVLTRPLPALLRCPLDGVQKVAMAIADHARDTTGLSRALAVSLPFYGTIILAQYLVLEAVGANVPLLEVALLAPLVPLLTLLPLSLNGLGLAEAVFVLLYGSIGVPPETALAAAALRRLVDLANSGLGGLLWLAVRGAATRREGGGVPQTAQAGSPALSWSPAGPAA